MLKLTNRLQIAFSFAAVLAVVGTATDAMAADEAIPFGKETFKISLGYYYPNFKSRMAAGLDASAPPGEINLEGDLGLQNKTGTYRLDGFWRFFDRHRMYFGYYEAKRHSSRVLTNDIGPVEIPSLGISETIKAGSNITTDSSWQVYILAYSYSFYKTDSLEFGGMVGLNVAHLGAKISGTFITDPSYPSPGVYGSSNQSALSVPLPAFGLTGDWAIDDRWRLTGHAGTFKIKINSIDAKVVDAGVSGEYRVYRNIWAGLGYSILNASAEKNDGSSNVSLDWRTGGPQIYASMLF